MSLYKDLKSYCLNNGDKPAFFSYGKYISYDKFLKKVDFYGDFYKNAMNFHEGMVISLCLDNSINSLAMIYAFNKIGVIINLINPSLPIDQIMYFDSCVRSRILILENHLYQEFYKEIKSSRLKIATIDNEYSLFKKIKRTIKFIKVEKAGIPLNFKKKFELLEKAKLSDDDCLAITAPNEKFDEKPLICSFLNSNLHQSMLNHSEIFLKDTNNKNTLVVGSIMSINILMSFIHPMLCNGYTIDIDENFIKRFSKYKPNVLASDESGIKEITLNIKTKDLLKGIKKYFIYSTSNIHVLKEIKPNISKNAKLYNLLGCVETCGAFSYKLENNANQDFSISFIGDFKPFIEKSHFYSKKPKQLFIQSKANTIGYYKEVDKNYEFITKNGFKTGFEGFLDKNNVFNITNHSQKPIIFNHKSPYLINLKDMLLTIPGIKNVDAINDVLTKTIKITLGVDPNQTIRIAKDVTDYLDAQLKSKNLNYKINIKD